MKHLEIGSLPLYRDGFALTNASKGLEWQPPAKAFATRGTRPALVAGYNYADKATTLTLQVRVSETSGYSLEQQLGRLRTALYATRTNDGGAGTFQLYSCSATGTRQWQLPVCALSSTVDIDHFSGRHDALATFTVTSAHQMWQAIQYTVVDLDASALVYPDFEGGPAPLGEFQAIFSVTDPGYARLYDGVTSSYITIAHGSVTSPNLDGVQTYYFRYDSATDSAGWVNTMTSWLTSFNANYDSLTPYISNPFPGLTLNPRQSTGMMSARITGAITAKLRFRSQRAVEL